MKKPLFFKASVLLDAEPELVWDTLINPEYTAMYMFHCEPVTDWQVGSPLLWRGKLDGTVYVSGKVLRFEPPQLLSFSSFNPQGPYPDLPENYLTTTYTLKKGREGVELSVAQGDFSNVPDGPARFEDAEGWEMILEAIQLVVEERRTGRIIPDAGHED